MQPRILSEQQIKVIHDRIVEWNSKVGGLVGKLEKEEAFGTVFVQ